MPIILRKIKNAPLTIDEIDGNFIDLDQRIEQLNQNLQKTVSIATVERNGNSLWFLSKTGEVIADVALPDIGGKHFEPPAPASAFVKLTTYDRSNLPAAAEIGHICTFIDTEANARVIFFDGVQWRNVCDNKPLIAKKG